MQRIVVERMALVTVTVHTVFFLHFFNARIVAFAACCVHIRLGGPGDRPFAVGLAVADEAFDQVDAMLAFKPVLCGLGAGLLVAGVTIGQLFRSLQVFKTLAPDLGKSEADIGKAKNRKKNQTGGDHQAPVGQFH